MHPSDFTRRTPVRRLSFGLFAATMLLALHTPRATIAADANAPAKNEMNRDWLEGPARSHRAAGIDLPEVSRKRSRGR